MSTPAVTPRSLLYVPAVRPELFDKAVAGAADAVIMDLEDAVPADRKAEARTHLRSWLDRERSSETDVQPASAAEVWIRVDPDALGDDLDVAARPGVRGVVLAKCTAGSLRATDEVLESLERERGLTPGTIVVIGLLESARALLELAQMTATGPNGRLLTFGIGEADLLGDLRMTRSDRSAAAMDALRIQVVVHCAAAGLAAPVAPTSTAFRDLEAFAETTRHFADLGFRSRTAVHPGQVPVVHEVLSPGAEEVERAREVMARFAAVDGGVTTDADGRLVDAAVVRTAREVLERAER